MDHFALRLARLTRLLALSLPAGLAQAAPLTTNQQAFNSAFDPDYYSFSLLSSALSDFSDAELPGIYSQLSGDTLGSYTSALMLSDIGLSNATLGNLRQSMDSQSTQPALWAQVGAGRQYIDGDGNAAAVRKDQRRSLIGGDLPMPGGWRLGGAIGRTEDALDNNARDADANTRSDSYSLYGGHDIALPGYTLRLFGGGAYSTHRIDSERKVGLFEEPERNKGDYDLVTQQTFGEVALKMPLQKPGYIEPFFGLLRIEQRSDAFSERGGGLSAATVDSQHNQLLVSSLGSRARQLFRVADRDLLVNGSLTWRHFDGDLRPEVQLKLADTSRFTVLGTEMPRSSVLLELKADYSLTPNLILDIDYNGVFSDQSRSHNIALNAHWKM